MRSCVYVCVSVRLYLLVTVYACGAVIFSDLRAVMCMSLGIHFVLSLPLLFLFMYVCWGGVCSCVCMMSFVAFVRINQFLRCSAYSVPLGSLFLVLNVYRCVISVCVNVRVCVRVCVCGWRRLSSSQLPKSSPRI